MIFIRREFALWVVFVWKWVGGEINRDREDLPLGSAIGVSPFGLIFLGTISLYQCSSILSVVRSGVLEFF